MSKDSVFNEILDELRSGDKYDTLLAEKAAAELAALRARADEAESKWKYVEGLNAVIVEQNSLLKQSIQEYFDWGPMTQSDRYLVEAKMRKALDATT